MRGAEPQLAISVDDGSGFVDLAGRQRLFPAAAATTSGSGDFAVTSSLVVGDPSSPTVALHNNYGGDPMVAGSNVAGNLHIDSNTPARGPDGSLYLNYYSDRSVRFARGEGGAHAAEINADGDLSAREIRASGLLGVGANLSAPNNVWDTCFWTDYFSDENAEVTCPNNHFVAGIQCTGGYCDNIRMYCCTL